jgi:hypothetical protein
MSHTVVSGNRVTGIIKTSEDLGACGVSPRVQLARDRVRDCDSSARLGGSSELGRSENVSGSSWELVDSDASYEVKCTVIICL